eukprot:3471505-Amphidinium_carterae.1
MGTVGWTGGPVGLELGAGFTFATGTKESITDCGGGLNPGGKITWVPSLAAHAVAPGGRAGTVGSAIAGGTGSTGSALGGGPLMAGGPIFPLASPLPFPGGI